MKIKRPGKNIQTLKNKVFSWEENGDTDRFLFVVSDKACGVVCGTLGAVNVKISLIECKILLNSSRGRTVY